MAADYATCPGPDGTPIPLVHFASVRGDGMLAVSFTDTHAVFTTPRSPFDPFVNPVMLDHDDRLELAALLVDGVPACNRCRRIRQIDVDSGMCQECLHGPLPKDGV